MMDVNEHKMLAAWWIYNPSDKMMELVRQLG